MPRRRRSRGRFLFKTTTRCLHPRLVHRPGRVCSLHLRGGVSQDSFFSLKSGPHDILIERQFHQTTNIPFTRVFLSLSPLFGVGMGPGFSAVFLFTSSPCVDYMFTQKVIFLFLSVSLDMARAHGSGLCRSAGGMKWEMERMGWRVWSGGGRGEGGTTTSTTINNNQPTFINNAMRCVFSVTLFFFFLPWFIEICLIPPPSSPISRHLALALPGTLLAHSVWVGRWEGHIDGGV